MGKTKIQQAVGIYLCLALILFLWRSLEAAGFDRENPDPYVLLGKIAYNNDDYNGDRINWRKAFKRKPDYAAVQSLLRSLEKDWNVENNFRLYESGNFILKFEGKRKQLVVDKTTKGLNRAYQVVSSIFLLCLSANTCRVIFQESS